MSERDFDKGYKSGFQFGKEVVNEEWLNKVKQAREEIDQAYEDFDGYDPQALCGYSSRVDEILDKLIESEEMKMIEVIKAEDIPNLGDYDIDIYNAIIVPRNATNGDMLLSMFDTATVYGIDKENDCIIICLDNNFYQKFRYSWWNVTYKRGSEYE